MLLSDSLLSALRWTGIGSFVLLIIGAFFLPKNVDRESPAGQRLKRQVLAVLGVVVIANVVGYGAAPLGDPVVIVRGAPGGEGAARRAHIYGSQSYVFQDNHSEILRGTDGGTTIVNDTANDLAIELATYGNTTQAWTSHFIQERRKAAPMKITSAPVHITFVGPDDLPAQTVKSLSGFEERYWLRW